MRSRCAMLNSRSVCVPGRALQTTTPSNAASLKLAQALEKETGIRVVVAFNEFCDPDMDEGLHQAAKLGVQQMVVITPGSEHAEVDIPEAIERARQAHPAVTFLYAWPIPLDATAGFLADHIARIQRGASGEGRLV